MQYKSFVAVIYCQPTVECNSFCTTSTLLYTHRFLFRHLSLRRVHLCSSLYRSSVYAREASNSERREPYFTENKALLVALLANNGCAKSQCGLFAKPRTTSAGE